MSADLERELGDLARNLKQAVASTDKTKLRAPEMAARLGRLEAEVITTVFALKRIRAMLRIEREGK